MNHNPYIILQISISKEMIFKTKTLTIIIFNFKIQLRQQWGKDEDK